MKVRLIFLFKYIVFWLLLFLLGKLTFLLYEYNESFDLPLTDWFRILQHGFRLDLSTTGYIVCLPTLILAFSSVRPSKPVRFLLNVYSFLMLVAFLLITLVDLEIYKYWGTRLDSAPLRFLNTPGETLASSSLITLVLYFSTFLLFSWLFFRIYMRYIAAGLQNAGKAGWPCLILFLFITASLILPIRGGLNVSVINTGSAFFHRNTFANHAAINIMWNFGHSIVENKETSNPYVYFRNKDYDHDLKQLYAHKIPSSTFIKSEKPDIVLIILESFSAKVIESLGGAEGVTPDFNNLCKKGLLFSNIYAADSRTDKALATILSGYPVLEAIPILRYPDRTQHLPYLTKSLIKHGYQASFHYGGDINFANIRSYLVNGDFSQIISGADFPAAERTGKWGVPDNYVFDRFLEDIRSDSGPWFHVMMTLSNHEPFEIPVNPKFGSGNLTEKFYSSAYYADSCLGDFIRRYKESGLWDNSVVILVADHGTRVPDFSEVYEPRKFHIPLLFTGGAMIKDTVVSKMGSQADIAVTLLNQLKLETGEFILGKDLLSPDSRSFVLYSYKNGIAMLTDSTGFGIDFISGDYNFSYGPVQDLHVSYARSLQQYVFDNYLGLSERKSRNVRKFRK
jgi:phosphoglycerol transferase MdoB-like AlkP superfamily enzyme